MDLSATRLGRLSEQERAKRITEKRYLYCGGLDHIIKNCSLRSARPLRVSKALLTDPDPKDESKAQLAEN